MERLASIVVVGLSVFHLHAGEVLGPAVNDLKQALEARLDSIGNPPPATEKKEYEVLLEARDSLERYKGLNDKKDFGNLEKAGRLVLKSTTADAAVQAALVDLVRAVASLVQTQQELAEDAGYILSTAEFRDKVNKITVKGSTRLELGESLIEADPMEAQKFLAKAYFAFLKSQEKGRALQALEERGKETPLCVVISPQNFGVIFIVNARWEPFDVENIYYSMNVTIIGDAGETAGAPLRLEANEVDSAAFEPFGNRVFPMSSYDITTWLPTRVPEGAKAIRYQGEIGVKTKQLKTFFVPYDFSFSL